MQAAIHDAKLIVWAILQARRPSPHFFTWFTRAWNAQRVRSFPHATQL